MLALYTLVLSSCSLAAARHVYTHPVILPRTVTSLDSAAVAEAQERDDTATRAFTNVQITTSDGRCLFVDKLSGDFRENLTPVQVAACGSTDGQGWDLITAGKHNNVPGAALVVSSLTNACLNFDPRRADGNQVLLFSCGGRADGGGDVANSQLFGLNSTSGPLSFEPENAAGSCVTVKGDVLDIAGCDPSDASQQFTFGSAASTLAGTSSAAGTSSRAGSVSVSATAAASPSAFVFANSTSSASAAVASVSASTPSVSVPSSCTRRTRTVVATVTETKMKGSSSSSSSSASVAISLTAGIANGAAVASDLFSASVASVASSDSVSVSSTSSLDSSASSVVTSSASVASSSLSSSPPSSSSFVSASSTATDSFSSTASSTDSTITGKVTAIAVPDTAVPVSRGGNFSPAAAAEANPRDDTATRAFSDVAIRAPNGQCLFVDPTAGDFRENLIPVSLVDCAGTPNEKWDVITAGAHNDVPGTALIVSTLTNGCISFDSRRAAGDTINMFPCGGRADGSGETNADQLMPFIGALSFAFAPTGENNNTCILASDTDTRLTSGACPTDGSQLFSVFP